MARSHEQRTNGNTDTSILFVQSLETGISSQVSFLAFRNASLRALGACVKSVSMVKYGVSPVSYATEK